MKINELKSNYLNTIGFKETPEFEGVTTLIDLEYSEMAFKFLGVLKEMGFKEIEFGIDINRRFLLFLFPERKLALIIAPKMSEKESD